ncbi:MAG: glycoside hydrolase family 97 catalytic domain-containing protein [Akkermansiaceae bacterium]|nr:glycoside hydrolase family 97 catalytic domain-containing protein [Akkermansiaceae bacterium]
MKIKHYFLIIPFSLAAATFLHAETSTLVHSPDKNTRVKLELKEGIPHWSVNMGSQPVIQSSRLGLQAKPTRYGPLQQLGLDRSTHDETWKPVWGKASSIRNHYQEAVWKLQETNGEKRTFNIVLRVFDHAVAVRYQFPGKGKQTFDADLTEFRFPADFTCWSANGENANHGPVSLSKYRGSQLPLTVRIADECYTSILEAHISDYAGISLKRIGPTAFQANMPASTVDLPSETSWRVLLLGKTPGDLLVNHTMVNLNPPCAIEDTSWIKPGIAMWDWRAWGAVADDGFVYDLGMESWKRHIDFASKHKLGYLLLDAGWYGLEFDPNEDPTTSRDHLIIQPHPDKPELVRKPAPKDWKHPIDVPALIQYAKKKNVGIILYLNDAAQKKHDLEKTLATYQQWGAAGIKYGFMRAAPQDKVRKTRRIVELCAKHKLLCDFHDGPVAPSGDRRTYPNYVTREFCHSQSDALRTFTPQTFCTTVFTNMLAGPLDMCNGLYSLNNAKKDRPKIFAEVYSTVTAETARVLITYSGLSLIPDIPEAYEAKADLFEFIAKLPMTWDETRILHGDIGHLITTARRSGDDWFVASCCDEKGRQLPIQLDFLKDGVSYTATLYEDGPDAHYKTNRESYKVRKISVKKGDTINAKLAPGGGHCIRLTESK